MNLLPQSCFWALVLVGFSLLGFLFCFFLKPNKRELESLVLYEYQSLEFLVQVCSLCVVLD